MPFSKNKTYWKLVSTILNCRYEKELERIYFTMNMKETILTKEEYNCLITLLEKTTGLSNSDF